MPKKTKNNRKRMIDVGHYNLSTGDPEDAPTVDFRSLTLRKMQTLEFLNGANMPSKFRFREQEIEKITNFLTTCVKKEKKGYRFLMVTGSPGAGKTLSVNSVLSSLDCQIIRINANIVKSVADVQDLICMRLLKDSTARTAPQILRQLQQTKYKQTCVVYIEEIQLLFKNAPGIVSQDFLLLFLKKSVNLVLLGISNTIDALQKYSGKYSFKITEIENIVFAPYQAKHIISIYSEKLELIKQKYQIQVDFPEKLLKFSASRLEALKKGDFRICLQFLKELLRLSFTSRSPNDQEEESSKFTITISLINQTLNKMNISKNQLMQTLSYHQSIILICLHNITSKTDALFVSLKELHSELKWICGNLQIGFSATLTQERIKDLQVYGMLTVRKKNINETQIILQVSSQDIQATFGDHQLLGKYLTNK